LRLRDFCEKVLERRVSRSGVTDDPANMGTIMRSAFMLLTTAISMSSHVVIADELPDCKTMRNAGKKMECLQNSIAILQKHATGNIVQMGSKAFGQDQSDSPNWSLQELPRAGPTTWTSPPISFAQQFATKPAVSVTIAGIESGANLDVDRFGFSAEATDINENGFKVTIHRSHGVLYGVTLNRLAYGPKKP
jgi:H-type lectin domain